MNIDADSVNTAKALAKLNKKCRECYDILTSLSFLWIKSLQIYGFLCPRLRSAAPGPRYSTSGSAAEGPCGAVLCGAVLYVFCGAVRGRAEPCGAVFCGAVFCGAVLCGALFSGAVLC